MIRSARKVASVLTGMASPKPVTRVRSAERLLAYLLDRLPADVRDDHLAGAPALTARHVNGARLFASREIMLGQLPKGGRVAEVGTWKGYFSKLIAATCQPDEFHLFDIDFGPLDEWGIFQALGHNKLVRHLGDSSTNLSKMPAEHFGWLYIDGHHSYESVRKDLAAAHLTLKPGGFMMCNDYTNWSIREASPYGVARAVNELCLEHGYTVEGFALHGAGYHDILIRKPA